MSSPSSARFRLEARSRPVIISTLQRTGPNALTLSVNSVVILAKRSPSEAETQSSRNRSGSSPAKPSRVCSIGRRLAGAVVAGIVVAFADVAAQHQHPVGALVEGAHDQFGRDPPEHGTRMARMFAGDFRRAMPAVSAPV